MKKILTLLFCFPLFVIGQITIGNNQAICLNDTVQIVATYAPGTSIGLTSSPILITECDLGSPDVVEIQNVSSTPVDVTGWRIIISNNYSDINTANAIEQVLSGNMIAGETKFFTDNSTNNYWGNNILWNPGAYPTFTTWIILLDDNNSVMDVFVGNWLAADIASSAIATSVGIISLAGHWNGNGINQATIGPTLQSFSRIGNEDHNDSTDFSIMATSSGVSNIGLSIPFSGGGATWYNQNTGQIVGTGDTLNYSPAQSTYILAEIIDTSGQLWVDSMYLEVLNTNITSTGFSLCNGPVVLTAPTGFATYNWSGASTSQVLTVTTPGTYFVNYLTSSGMSCQSDPITIYSGNIPITLSTPDSVFICQGDTVVIDGPLGFTNYFWSTGATNSSITTTSTGNYSLSVLDGNGCTGTSNTTTVTISPQTITATTTGFSLCNGSVTLNAGSGFSSYQWYINGTIMTNETNQTLIATIAGNYTVEVTYPTGCTATSNPLTIYSGTGQFYFFINTIGDDSLCLPNGQVILDAGNYSSFSWNTGETTQQIIITTLGTFSVNVIDANGCQGASNPPFIVSNIVNTSVITGPTNPTQFQTETYSVLPSAGSTYNWNVIGATIQSGNGTNSIDILWNNTGTFSFSVTETDLNGCVGEPVSLMVSVIISSIREINNPKKINKITDVLGRKVSENNNTLLFYIYDDGTVEKKIIID